MKGLRKKKTTKNPPPKTNSSETGKSKVITRGKEGAGEEEEGKRWINGDGRRLDFWQ